MLGVFSVSIKSNEDKRLGFVFRGFSLDELSFNPWSQIEGQRERLAQQWIDGGWVE